VSVKLDFSNVAALTFDCYGTLIDWETGILRALRAVLEPRGISRPDDELLEAYARHETALEAGAYRTYRSVLAESVQRIAAELGARTTLDEERAFAASVGDWPPFADTRQALQRLATRFRLGVISNCDDDLFAVSNRSLEVTFDWVITAQQAASYKPSQRNFELALERIALPRERIVHVAQSLYHDHEPAAQLGIRSVWINRRHGRTGQGATPPADARPEMEFPNLETFAEMAVA
jgi:2-haloacid dehalogenase